MEWIQDPNTNSDISPYACKIDLCPKFCPHLCLVHYCDKYSGT